jgi:hypothetical protein
MEAQQKLRIQFELIWWVITILLLLGVLYPIYRVNPAYPFWGANVIFIILFVTAARYLFFLRHAFFGRIQWAKILLILIIFPLTFYLVNEINFFQTTLDEEGPEYILGQALVSENLQLIGFIRAQYILFGVGSVIASVALGFRLLISLWRYHNKGLV